MAAAIGLNLDLLDARQRELFSLLGVFPEDADIPVGIVARLWAEGGEPDEFATLDLLAEFYDLSLLLDLDLNRHTIRFHDTTCHFLQDEAKKRGVLAAQHQRLAEAMADLGRDNPAFAGNSAPPSAETVYYYRYLPTHLAGAGAREQLDALLLDPGWLEAKLAATDSPQTLVADYEQFGEGEVQFLIGRTLRLITGICARHTRQILPQLHGRLMECREPAALSRSPPRATD